MHHNMGKSYTTTNEHFRPRNSDGALDLADSRAVERLSTYKLSQLGYLTRRQSQQTYVFALDAS